MPTAGSPPAGSSGSTASPASGGQVLTVGPTPQGVTELPGWIGPFGGRNDKVPAHAMGQFECDRLENLFIDAMTLRSRGGRAKILDTLSATTWTSHGGTRVYNLTGSPFDYIAGNFDGTTRLKSSRTAAWADILTGYAVGSDARVEFVPAAAAQYVLFGSTTENARKITGADSVANAAWSSGGQNIRPSMGMWHKKRLWLDDVTVGREGRVWLSDTELPDTFQNQTTSTITTQGGYITLLLPDGDHIRGMASFGGFGVIMSERSIHLISGSNFSNMTIVSAFQFGTKSPRSLVVAENDLWFLDNAGRVRFLSQSQPNVNATVAIGTPGYFIEPLTTAITQANLPKVCAAFHDRRFWLYYASSGSTNNAAVSWDFRELPFGGSRWGSHTNMNAGAAWTGAGSTDAELIYYLDATTPVLRNFPSGTTDDGTAIPFAWKSRGYHYGVPAWNKGMEVLAPVALGFTGTLTLNLYLDLSTTLIRAYSLVYAGGAFERQEAGRVAADVEGGILQMELTGSSSAGFELAGIEAEPVKKRRRT